MKKRGFTLVELLAVIAILAILILVVLPNTIGLFNTSKKNSFTNESKTLLKSAQGQWANDYISSKSEIVYASTPQGNCERMIDLSGRTTLYYYIKMDKKGNIIEFYSQDDTYQYSYSGRGLKAEDIDDVVEISKIEDGQKFKITCSGISNSSTAISEYTLTVNPNGGEWNGSTSSQKFKQASGTIKTISNPSKTPKYIITYDANSQDATFNVTQGNVGRKFSGWTLSGEGSINNTRFKYGAGDATLTATYSNESEEFTLPTITKDNSICKWAEGSVSGTQYEGGKSRKITSDTTYYAVCVNNKIAITLNGNGATTQGSTSTIVEYNTNTLKAITLPQRKYTVSFDLNSTGASADTTTKTATYIFNGWDTKSTGGIRIANNSSTPVLEPNVSGYTNASGNWIKSDGAELFAQWTSSAVLIPAISKNGYTCSWNTSQSGTGAAYTSGATLTPTSNTTLYAICNGNYYQLEVNPGGQTWNGSTNTQTFTGQIGTTKTIDDPSTLPKYTISYNANSQGATYTSSPTSVERAFNKWNLTGSGSLSGKNYKYGAGKGTLTAVYNTTSKTFRLPEITKTGHTCKWAEGSTSGTQYAGNTSKTITSNTTYYAVCGVNTVTCTSGYYLEKNKTSCTKCSANNYCPGGNYVFSTTINQGINPCPNGYTNAAGSSEKSSCKITCQANTRVNEVDKTCSPCATGYIISSHTVSAGSVSEACTIASYTLTVNPNGGVWSGSSSNQTFTDKYGATKLIPNPTTNPTYTISYNGNNQNASFTSSPSTVEKTFNKWNLTGGGSFNNVSYIFTGNGTLTAKYNTTSKEFNLPAISKVGNTCKWAEGTSTGTQYSGGAKRTISSNTIYFARCSVNSYNLTVNPNGGIWMGESTNQNYRQNYGTTMTINDPTSGPTLTITYNMNGTGITAPTSPTSVQKPFSNWSLSGKGSMSGKTYTFGEGGGTLTANYLSTSSNFTLPSISKVGHTCKWAEGSTSGTQYTGGSTRAISSNTTYYAVCTLNSYKLTVNPNGGTWGGKTTNQEFTQNYGTTKTISNPTSGPTYSITYNMNGTGITAPTSPTSVQRPFTSWTNSGSGSISGTTYTFGAGAGTLTANYNTTSSSFTLPALSKSGYTCKWAEGSTSGTQYTGGTSRTLTGNKTYYAVCTANSYKLTVKPNGGTWGGKTTDQDFTQVYGTTKSIANPTAGPTYSITYNMNGTGLTAPSSPKSVQRPFDSWIAGGSGSISGTTYTFGAGAGTLTAIYKTESNKFTLPALSKNNFTCNWLEDSASGTQYAPGAQLSISSNKTYYAKCVENCKWLCPTGYSGDGSGGCVQTKDASASPYCPSGSKDMDASGFNFGTYSYYDCYNTSSFSGSTCVGKPYKAYGDNSSYCFSYYSYSYYCDSGWTLSGTSCYRTASKECRVSECTWKCPAGYTANSSNMCEKTTAANSQGVCPSGSKDMVASGLNFGTYSHYDCYQHWSFPGSTYAGTPYTAYGDNNKYYFSNYASYQYTCSYGGVLNGQTCKYTVEKDCN